MDYSGNCNIILAWGTLHNTQPYDKVTLMKMLKWTVKGNSEHEKLKGTVQGNSEREKLKGTVQANT